MALPSHVLAQDQEKRHKDIVGRTIAAVVSADPGVRPVALKVLHGLDADWLRESDKDSAVSEAILKGCDPGNFEAFDMALNALESLWADTKIQDDIRQRYVSRIGALVFPAGSEDHAVEHDNEELLVRFFDFVSEHGAGTGGEPMADGIRKHARSECAVRSSALIAWAKIAEQDAEIGEIVQILRLDEDKIPFDAPYVFSKLRKDMALVFADESLRALDSATGGGGGAQESSPTHEIIRTFVGELAGNEPGESVLPWILQTISMMPETLGETRVGTWKEQALQVFERSSSQQSRIEAINLLAAYGTLPPYEIIRDILIRPDRMAEQNALMRAIGKGLALHVEEGQREEWRKTLLIGLSDPRISTRETHIRSLRTVLSDKAELKAFEDILKGLVKRVAEGDGGSAPDRNDGAGALALLGQRSKTETELIFLNLIIAMRPESWTAGGAAYGEVQKATYREQVIALLNPGNERETVISAIKALTALTGSTREAAEILAPVSKLISIPAGASMSERSKYESIAREALLSCAKGGGAFEKEIAAAILPADMGLSGTALVALRDIAGDTGKLDAETSIEKVLQILREEVAYADEALNVLVRLDPTHFDRKLAFRLVDWADMVGRGTDPGHAAKLRFLCHYVRSALPSSGDATDPIAILLGRANGAPPLPAPTEEQQEKVRMEVGRVFASAGEKEIRQRLISLIPAPPSGSSMSPWFLVGAAIPVPAAMGLFVFLRKRKRTRSVRVFLSYRRSDASVAADNIYRYLCRRFGADQIFKDVNSIPIGVDFRDHLAMELQSCNVFVAIIGENWLNAQGSDGKRRLDDPTDFVRIETEFALERGIPIVPVLIGRVRMPTENDLPASMTRMAFQQSFELRPGPEFDRDLAKLAKGIGGIRSDAKSEPAAQS